MRIHALFVENGLTVVGEVLVISAEVDKEGRFNCQQQGFGYVQEPNGGGGYRYPFILDTANITQHGVHMDYGADSSERAFINIDKKKVAVDEMLTVISDGTEQIYKIINITE